jgi:hypothetical protein
VAAAVVTLAAILSFRESYRAPFMLAGAPAARA